MIIPPQVKCGEAARLRGRCEPALEQRLRVDRPTALLPGALPHLEVEVRALGLTGGADVAYPLTGDELLPDPDARAAGGHVHERVVVVGMEHDVVAGAARLVVDERDRPAVRRHDRNALRGEEVEALMGVARARRAELAAGTGPLEGPRDGEAMDR